MFAAGKTDPPAQLRSTGRGGCCRRRDQSRAAAAGLDIHRLADVVERSPLVPGQIPPPPRDDSAAGDWRAMRRFCADHDTLLSAREREFIADIKRWRGRLTPKQHDWLTRSTNGCRTRPHRASPPRRQKARGAHRRNTATKGKHHG